MAVKAVKVRLSGYKGGSDYMNGLYHVAHNGLQLSIMPDSWLRNDKVSRIKRQINPKGTPNINIRSAIAKKLGLRLNAGGGISPGYSMRKATGRKTFRGMTFAEIRATYQKYE